MKEDVAAIERATTQGLSRLSYEEWLKDTWLYRLERRKLQGDMIETFKIMKSINKVSAEEFFRRIDNDRTRGHSLRVKTRELRWW